MEVRCECTPLLPDADSSLKYESGGCVNWEGGAMSEPLVVERPESLAFDSTQTLRAMSLSEIRDPNQQKWFVVQLAVSDQPVNLQAMPRLDVFSAHRLYAVEGQQGSSTRYSLRLGFFNEEHSAQMICGYVKTFFRSPSVVRVSAAEWKRFESPAYPKEPLQTAARPGPNVVELGSVRASSGVSSTPPAYGRSVDQHGNRANMKRAAEATSTTAALTGADARPMPQPSATVLARAAQPRTTAGDSHEPVRKKKSLAQELLEEARQIELSKSGRNRIPKRSASWLSRLLGRS